MRLAVLAVAGLIAAAPSLPASAADGSSDVGCSTGSSCYIELQKMIRFGGNYSPGANNMVVNITPPACLWIPIGDAHSGSQYVLDFYNNTDPGPGALFDGEHAFAEARQLVNATPMPAGTWYYLPVRPDGTEAQRQACLAQPLYFWDPPGTPLPGIQVPPRTLAQMAMAKMLLPGAGRMSLSPRTGNSYSNLPTFVRVALQGQYEAGPGGRPYLTVTARLGNVGATVWAQATPLQLSASDSSARLEVAGCGYLGSAMMVRNPGAVARTGANGHPDGGGTLRRPGGWQVTAQLTWQTCWVPQVVNNSPPPADCGANPVPGAQLNPVNWARNVNVHEIQAANGGG